MSVNENTLFRPELDLYLTVAAGKHFALTELGVVYPVSFTVGFARGIVPGGFARSRLRGLSFASPPGYSGRALSIAFLTKVVATAAGSTDDYGGRAVLIQSSHLMRAFGFAPPALRSHFISQTNFLYPDARAHK